MNFTIIVYLLWIVINCLAQQISQTVEIYGNEKLLNIQIILSSQFDFQLTFYNNKTHSFEILNCSNLDRCGCQSPKFSNFYCFENNGEYHFHFSKQPYVNGDTIIKKENKNQIQNNNEIESHSSNSHFRILDLEEYLNKSLAAQTVTYTDSDLSSSLQLGTYELYMKWEIYTNGSFDMAIDYNQLNWIGFGFCPTMSNCDMIILYLSQQTVIVMDTFSYGQSTPRTDKSNDINIVSYAVNSTGYKVRFNRKLDTGDTSDQVLAKGDKYTFCVAWSGADQIEMHSAWYNFDITFDNGIVGQATLSNGDNILFYVHAVVLFIAWGIVADFGIIIGRFFKSINSYLWIHAICFIFVDLSTIVLVVLMLFVGGDSGNTVEDGALEAHKIMSIVLGLAVIIQHTLGVVVKHFLESTGKENRQALFTIRMIHIVLGTVMYLAAKVVIILGFIKNEEKLLLVLGIIWTVLLILVRIGLEIYKSFNSSIRTKIAPQQQQPLSEQQTKLLKLLQGNHPTASIIKELPQIKWVLFNSDVYDVTDYQHPGGNFIISNVNGQEISRYFYGAFQLESTTMEPYTHSQFAYQTLLKRYVGTIQSVNYNNQNPGSFWDLIEKVDLSKNISLFNFTNPNFQINLRQNVLDLGQHFSVSLQEVGGKIRMYTKVLCMSNPYQTFREQVIKYNEGKITQPPLLQFDKINTVPLIIKKYNFPKALSAQIFEHQGNFWVQGPFGRGLELESKSKCIAFVGGTGLLPFLDLLDHLLMKSIYLTNKQKQQQIQQFFPQYDQLEESFEFTLLASFQNEEEFIGKDWIRKLYQINQTNNLKLFNMQIRYSDSTLDTVIPAFRSRFNEELVRQHLGDFNKKVYICGPPNMIYSLTQIISKTEQDQTKVMIV
ncbi:unnamed protein product (macronuclear) [Paramecium tetraurelia]|uniref:DOMON domain-containing protein n=1 Tax=Paramecium tetraurelia TaxID=5888 RepID=A0CM85_PARTE|nr:uncharacterized protein GSPATT00008381001 [Paramecium tetraurelia]CAK71902.1 unnamed protein product [Paramecium tetraurelia]|eukprot:XP_001439299.1 hypothetical protein (macronuclear) [Paramecium tetraurelia strain d4-2]